MDYPFAVAAFGESISSDPPMYDNGEWAVWADGQACSFYFPHVKAVNEGSLFNTFLYRTQVTEWLDHR